MISKALEVYAWCRSLDVDSGRGEGSDREVQRLRADRHKHAWHRKKASSGADAALFFLVFASGSAGIFLLKQNGYEQLTITALPCSLLIIYAAIVKYIPRFRLREDQAGDNCYYLGFLFTLFSLSLALAAFVRAGGTEEIVEDFGIALASTIIGLALRVAFNQMRQDPVEIEREARLELAAAAQRLRSELDQSVVEMNVFRRATQQSIADGLEELNSKVSELLEKNLARYDQITRGSAERIDQTLAAFAEKAQRLNDVANKTAGAIETLTARIEAIKAPEDLVETKLAPAATAVAEMVTELRERAGAEAKEFRQLRKMIEAASGAQAGLDDRISAVAKSLEGLERLGGALDTAERRLSALTTGLDEAEKALAASINAWREAVVGEAERMRTALESTSGAIAATGDELRRALSEPAREASAALTAIANQAESLREIEAQLQRLPALLEREIDALSRLREEAVNTRRFFPFRWSR